MTTRNGSIAALIGVLAIAISQQRTASADSCSTMNGVTMCISASAGDFSSAESFPDVRWFPDEDIDDLEDAFRVVPNFSPGQIIATDTVRKADFSTSEAPPVDVTDDAVAGGAAIDMGPYLDDEAAIDYWDEALDAGVDVECPMGGCLADDLPVDVPMSTVPRDAAVDEEANLAVAKDPDPVNAENGELVLRKVDVAYPGFGVSFQHRRIYRSRVRYDGPLGHGWDHTYNQRLVAIPDTADWLYATGGGTLLRFRVAGTAADDANVSGEHGVVIRDAAGELQIRCVSVEVGSQVT